MALLQKFKLVKPISRGGVAEVRENLLQWPYAQNDLDQWLNINPTQTFGRAPTTSDIAILTLFRLKSLFGLARQTSGLMAALFDLMQVELSVPDHPSTS